MARSTRRKLRSRIGTLAGLILLLATSWVAVGCVAEAGVVYGYPVVEASYVPARIEYYPRVYYRGGYAYYVDGYWYYPSAAASRGWVVFRDEPHELRRYRVEERWEQPRYYRAPQYGVPHERYPRHRYPYPR
jgi:hypothetical protein